MLELSQSYMIMQRGQRTKKTWTVDLGAAMEVQRWASRNGGRLLAQEIQDMGQPQHLPHWILTVGHYYRLASCPNCQNAVVFDRGLRCVACETSFVPDGGMQLAWFGMFPAGIEGLNNLRAHLREHPIPSHPMVKMQEKLHMLVPLQAFYHGNWPNEQPHIHYLEDIFSLPHISWDHPQSSIYHVLAKGEMCLYLRNWAPVTMREVLMTRALPHVHLLLSYCNGNRRAFTVATRYH